MVLYVVPAFQVLPVTFTFISEDSTEGDGGFGAHLLGCSVVC